MADCETAKLYVLKDIKELKLYLKLEKIKLEQLRKELEEHRENDDIDVEKAKGRKRIRQIEKLKGKVQDLISECKSLDKVMAVVEKDTQIKKQQADEKKVALRKVEEDIGFVDDELYALEDKIKRAKESNVFLEKELKTEAMFQRSKADAVREQKMLENRKEAEEAEHVLETLTKDVKRKREECRMQRLKLSTLQSDCKEEERKNTEISAEIEKIDKLKAKHRRQEEALMREIPQSAS